MASSKITVQVDIEAMCEGKPIELQFGREAIQEKRDAGCDGCKQLGLWDEEMQAGHSCPCIRCRRSCKDHYET
jgi:hypothetical protein